MILEVHKKHYLMPITNFVLDTCRELGEKNASAGLVLLTAEDNGSDEAKGWLRSSIIEIREIG